MLRVFRLSERVSALPRWYPHELNFLNAVAPPTRGFAQGTTTDPLDHIEEFRETVRNFAQGFVAPHAAEIDKTNR
jgi:hypothetical protein